MPPNPNQPDWPTFQTALLKWYTAHHRTLPWRATPGTRPNPYDVLVSEAMLQQTQIATVIDYFNRFIQLFPTVQALAKADVEQVLHAWQGLGYYRRARHLHAAAQMIVNDYEGQVPDSVNELLKLPGVGRYSAGAIASIAYNQPAPILDGNVIRVLARICHLDDPVDTTPMKKQLWSLAEACLPDDHFGEFNQGLMELGATICLPRGPRCLFCPVVESCQAYAAGEQERLPITSKRTPQKPVTHRVFIIKHGDHYAIRQRPADGLWAGMWELPTLEGQVGKPLKSLSNQLRDLAELAGVPLTLQTSQPHSTFTHLTTHRRITFEIYQPPPPDTPDSPPEIPSESSPETVNLIWVTADQLDAYPMSNPQRRIVASLLQP